MPGTKTLGAICVFFVALVTSYLAAGEDKPLLATPGKLLFEDDFSRTEIGPKWKVGW